MISRESPVYKTLIETHEEWEIEDMIEDFEDDDDFFDPMEDYGIPYRGEF